MIAEYTRHLIIGSPLESLVTRARAVSIRRTCRRQPEIAEALGESLYFEEIFREFVRDGMNCVDAGAHLGAVLSQFTRLSPSGRHIAFEPTPYKARWLREKFPRADIVEAALSDEPGNSTFYHQPKSSGYNGLKLHDAGINDVSGVQEMTVQCVRLDDAIGDRPVGFIKIDVEGAELLALHGAARTLERDRPPMLIECTHSGLSAFGFSARSVFDLLASHRYELFLPRPASQRGRPLDAEGFQKAMIYPFQAWNFLALPK